VVRMKSLLIFQFTERRHITAAPESVSIKKRREVQLELRDEVWNPGVAGDGSFADFEETHPVPRVVLTQFH
jgi:hypothetical protein